MFSISLITLDSYQSTPISALDVTFSDFRGSEIRQVPVIRIFGSTSTGTKTCLHMHGVFPYLYVPCTTVQDVDSFVYRLAAAMDSAINVSMGSTMSNKQHVYKIQKVSGIPIYGYHTKEHQFFKMYFYNPNMIKKAADLLQNCAVLNQCLQPHEAHIPFIQQFMIDYNLYGMSSINLSHVKYRQRTHTVSEENSQNESFLNLPNSQKYLSASVARQSTSELEVDAQASDILNRQEIEKGLDLNPGIAAIWNDEMIRRDAKGLRHAESQLLYTKSCDNRVYGQTDTDIYQEERLVRRLQLISQTNESTMSSAGSTFSYPLEVENEDNSLDASHVLNHFQPSTSYKNSFQKMSLNSKVLELERSEILDQTLTPDKCPETNILDADDMHLVEILANLAHDSDEENAVENDSVLGSQYSSLSDQIKDDNEEEDVEDLNITVFDLESLSSWNSTSRAPSQSSIPETDIQKKTAQNIPTIIEENSEDLTLLNFPQCDGANDLIKPVSKQISKKSSTNLKLRTNFRTCEDFLQILIRTNGASGIGRKIFFILQEYYSSKFITIPTVLFQNDTNNRLMRTEILKKSSREFKSKRRKAMMEKDTFHQKNSSSNLELDHRDLDVFDIDKIEFLLSLINSTCKEISDRNFSQKKTNAGSPLRQNISLVLSVPALDGNTVESASDTESDQDVTIQREEKRICIYKSATKSKEGLVLNITPKKRKIDVENSDQESPCKRKNIDSKTIPDQSCTTPCKLRTPTKARTPRSPRGLSGKYTPLNITVLSPKTSRNSVEKSDSLKNEICATPKNRDHKLRISLLREKSCSLSSKMIHVHQEKKNESYKESTENSVLEFPNVSQKTKSDEHSVTKISKEVRKRLSFLNGDENETIPVEPYSENSPLAECIMTRSTENKRPDDISAINERTDYEENLPSTSKHGVPVLEDLIETDDDLEMNLEEEEDACNMTFSQFISTKLKVNNQSFLSLESTSDITRKKLITITTRFNPPSKQRIIDSMNMYGISQYKSIGPFFSNKLDMLKQKGSANKNPNFPDLLQFKSNLDGVTGIKLWRRVKVNEFHPSGASIKSCDIKRALAGYKSLIIQPLIEPPTPKSIKTWIRAKEYLKKKSNKLKKKDDCLESTKNRKDLSTNSPNHPEDKLEIKQNTINETSCPEKTSSQHSSESNDSLNPSLCRILENPLLYKNNGTQQQLGISHGQIDFSMKRGSVNLADENLQNARGLSAKQFLTILSVEVHVSTRGTLLPDPEHDSIEALFYAIYIDGSSSSDSEQMEHGVILINSSIQNQKMKNIHSTGSNCPTSYVTSEEELLNSLLTLMRHCDPDILVGWEIESLSWGYIFQRASRVGFNNFMSLISRVPNVAPPFGGQTSEKENTSDIKVTGRIILDVWRIMRHEAALLNYTFENIMYHVMHERVSCPTFKHLTDWWKHVHITIRWRVISHYTTRVLGTLKILIHLDVIGRTCEHARLFGIQFYEVFSRGSQFRVESMMLRLAKPLNYIPISPSVQQRAKMRAPESLPLIMEPESTFYTDPLIVLDFQSLYPSIIMAYNYCFSTCLGRIEFIGQYEPYPFGAATLKVKKSTALKLQGKVNYAPCGVAFIKSEVRQGILPRMLTEILNTRLMVKESMKLHGKENCALQRILHSQQLGLKLIANVTYGYTAANFSGRMPCAEVADSVVSKGRETLERAIKIVQSTPKWEAQVVYGDTDSLFILLPGKSKDEAFGIGAEIADAVTAANPPPVKLKFEKVLYPSILQTKKRYCGYMYEYPEQKEPEYLAKGIETVRRDGCPAVAKILEKSLKILFDTKDLSLVKLYVTRQLDKILRRRISIQDLTFAKEFRGLRGYKPAACVPALELTRRLMRKDPRAIPRTGERVRYIIVAGAPNQALIQCVRTPMEVISDEGLTPNSVYYITKVVIPPLNRCFNLIGIDVNTWYSEMSHRQAPDKLSTLFTVNQKSTIRQFFTTTICAACGEQTKDEICAECIARPSRTVTVIQEKMRWLERTHHELTSICQSCTGYSDEPKCESLDCPILFRLAQARRELVQIPYLNGLIHNGENTHFGQRNA